MVDLSIGRADFEALAADILEEGYVLRFRARGGSMYPFIRDGDVLEVQPIGNTSAIRRGDVVLCRNEGDRVVAHRVIRLEREGDQVVLVVQGDALVRPDGRVFREQVLGRIVAVERGGSRVKVDAGLPRVLGWLWIAFAPFSRRLYRVLTVLRMR